MINDFVDKTSHITTYSINVTYLYLVFSNAINYSSKENQIISFVIKTAQDGSFSVEEYFLGLILKFFIV
jgi:hypothetical protein